MKGEECGLFLVYNTGSPVTTDKEKANGNSIFGLLFITLQDTLSRRVFNYSSHTP